MTTEANLNRGREAAASLNRIAHSGGGAAPGAARILYSCHTLRGSIGWDDLAQLDDRRAALDLFRIVATDTPFNGLEDLGFKQSDVREIREIGGR